MLKICLKHLEISKRRNFLWCLACCLIQDIFMHSFLSPLPPLFHVFYFLREMIFYEIYFPLPLIFKYNFVKILLLMTFISISISLKTSNILESKSQVFERCHCTITVHNDLYYSELKI